MWTIYKKSVWDKLKLTLIYSAVGLFMFVLYVSIQPTFAKQSGAMEQYLQMFPKEFLTIFNVDSIASMTTLEGMLSTEQFGLLWPILTIIFITNIAANALAGEVEKKTIPLILSQPISRAKVFIAKYLGGITNIILYILLTITINVVIAKFFNVSMSVENTLKFTLEAGLFTLFFYNLAYMVSSIVSQTGVVNFVTMGIFFGMYFMKVIMGLQKSLENLKYFTAFYYYDPSRSYVRGELMNEGLILFSVFSLIFLIIGFIFFKKRDIAV